MYKVSTGVLTFEFTDASNVVHAYDSDAGLIKVGGRIDAMITYDGAYVRMYYNGYLHKSFAQTDNIHSSTNKVYIGVFLKGIEAEVMFWSRTLLDQEVLELHFFPLFRVVGGGGAAASGWDCSIDVSSPQHGTTSPSGTSHQNTGESLEVLASKINVAIFKQWRFDGAIYSTDNPVTIPAQDDGSFHALIAEFTGAIGIGTPVIAQIMGIRDIHVLTPLLAPISTYVATPILSALVLSALATVVSAVASSVKWLLDVSYSPTFTMSPVGWQVLAPGATCAVTATPNAQQAALGYVTHVSPFKLDGGASVGTTDSSGVASYTVPAQTNNTLHQLIVQSVFGWGCSGAGTTTDAYYAVSSGSFKVYSRSSNPDGSHHSVWTLDGSIVGGNISSYTVAAQTNGTYHLIVHQIVAN